MPRGPRPTSPNGSGHRLAPEQISRGEERTYPGLVEQSPETRCEPQGARAANVAAAARHEARAGPTPTNVTLSVRLNACAAAPGSGSLLPDTIHLSYEQHDVRRVVRIRNVGGRGHAGSTAPLTHVVRRP